MEQKWIDEVKTMIGHRVALYDQGWTNKTAISLWCDKKFIEKRINEQDGWCKKLGDMHNKGLIYSDRFWDIYPTACFQRTRFINRLKELNKVS